MPDPRVRLDAWTQFVKRALAQAKQQRGWSVENIAERAAVSANTIYLWRGGKGTAYPRGENVEAFCDALDIAPEHAFAVLWPGKSARRTEPHPLNTDDDLLLLARRLADPSVPEREKWLIRETVQSLSARTVPREGST